MDKMQPPRRMQPGRTADFVPESRFGLWFLGTRTWEHEVVRDSIARLASLIRKPRARYPVVLDAGCGQGVAFSQLQQRFGPRHLIGLDRDAAVLTRARALAATRGLRVELLEGDCSALPLPDACVDLVFCHQTFHHLVHQERALREFHRILKPHGLLLLAESTRAYINTWCIRLLFRHPPASQRSAAEFLAMIRYAGFAFDERSLQFPYLWWSRASFRGMLEILHLRRTPPRGARRETLIYAALGKFAASRQS